MSKPRVIRVKTLGELIGVMRSFGLRYVRKNSSKVVFEGSLSGCYQFTMRLTGDVAQIGFDGPRVEFKP